MRPLGLTALYISHTCTTAWPATILLYVATCNTMHEVETVAGGPMPGCAYSSGCAAARLPVALALALLPLLFVWVLLLRVCSRLGPLFCSQARKAEGNCPLEILCTRLVWVPADGCPSLGPATPPEAPERAHPACAAPPGSPPAGAPSPEAPPPLGWVRASGEGDVRAGGRAEFGGRHSSSPTIAWQQPHQSCGVGSHCPGSCCCSSASCGCLLVQQEQGAGQWCG